MNETVALLQGFRRICVLCPHCEEVVRLSDASPYFRSRAPRTALDDLENLSERIERARTRLADQEGAIREAAVEKGRLEMKRRLGSIARFYRRQRIELEDLKLVFHPVDYVAFRGLADRRCTRVEFIDCLARSNRQERLQKSLDRVLRAGDYSWITMRVADDGRVSCE